LLATTKAGNSGEYEYATADHLGSPRAWTGSDGNLVAGGRHDYAPFGGELFAGYGTRTTGQGYAASAQQDGQRKQFDSHERDGETGLDFMQARYYSSLQGRFTSADPINITAMRMLDPQQFNLYSYVRNNPLSYTDPTGMYPMSDEERRKEIRAQIADAKKRAPGLPTPTVDQIDSAISKLAIGGYNYEPSDNMIGPLAAAYILAFQNEYLATEDVEAAKKFGSTTLQNFTVKNSTSETESTTVGVTVGGETGVSSTGPSGKASLSVTGSKTGSATNGAEVSVTGNIRQNSAEDRFRSNMRERTQFVNAFGKSDYMGRGLGAEIWVGSPFINDGWTTWVERLNTDYAGKMFDKVQMVAQQQLKLSMGK